MKRFELGKYAGLLSAVVCSGLLLAQPAAAVQQYQITALPEGFAVTSLNNSGQVAGTNFYDGAVWSATNGISLLANPAVNEEVHAINSFGQVAGSVSGQPIAKRAATFWDEHGQATVNMNLGSDSRAFDVNDAGQVVGYKAVDGLGWQAFVWDTATGDHQLLEATMAYGINNSGQVVGYKSPNTPGESTQAFVWDEVNGMQTLGLLGGTGRSEAKDINEIGQIVGWSSDDIKAISPFIWDNVNGMQALGEVEGTLSAVAYAINNSGQVVGSFDTNERMFDYACLWEGNQIYSLESLLVNGSGWELNGALDINESGQIIGFGSFDGNGRSFIATPVPEPASMMLLASGLFGLAGVNRKKFAKEQA